ncbi:hypothetical protein T4B_10574 [Trichinella pseudospiralis]|uniref:Uncharacterized protein n=2 Tax=Trichinella pseudospiralis TaxID=6337 RepID=A0A0V1GPU4_TRIPS|nr:hypothetical protein T4B_10574 [Trichinella pseudospiralis]
MKKAFTYGVRDLAYLQIKMTRCNFYIVFVHMLYGSSAVTPNLLQCAEAVVRDCWEYRAGTGS